MAAILATDHEKKGVTKISSLNLVQFVGDKPETFDNPQI